MTITDTRPATSINLREMAAKAHQEAEHQRAQDRQRMAECAWIRKQDVFLGLLQSKLGIEVERDDLGEIQWRDVMRPMVKLDDICLASMPASGQSPDLAVVSYCAPCNETHWFRINGLEHLGRLLESRRLCWKLGPSDGWDRTHESLGTTGGC